MTEIVSEERPGHGASVATQVAVLSERVNGLRLSSQGIERKLDTALTLFVTKEELKSHADGVDEKQKVANRRLDKLEGYLSWVVKIVVGLVVAAVVGLVIVKGKGG